MGYGRCASCGKKDYRDEVSFSCCEMAGNWGEDGDLCEDCSSDKTATRCSKCKLKFCEEHGSGEKEKCCGWVLCGFANDDENGGNFCHEDHEVLTLEDCGHKTCNYYKKKGCFTCNMNEEKEVENGLELQDKKLVEEFLANVQSKDLKRKLSKWMERFPKEEKAPQKASKRPKVSS